MKYLISPLKQPVEVVDFGMSSSVVTSRRESRTGRTEICNVMCELLAGQRSSEDSRPDRRLPWTTSASVQCYQDNGDLDYHALRYERGKGVEAASGDLPDISVNVLGYANVSTCGWYHGGTYLSASSAHTGDWATLVHCLGLLASHDDASFKHVINEGLGATGLPLLAGGSCVNFGSYLAEFERADKKLVEARYLTMTERAGIIQVCAQILPWLLHVRMCAKQGVTPLETCYCIVDDAVEEVDFDKVSAVMQQRFPNNRFLTLVFKRC